ncbi:hypothetical protein Hanom_Chr12g01077181 [Helianthus anomalus]
MNAKYMEFARGLIIRVAELWERVHEVFFSWLRLLVLRWESSLIIIHPHCLRLKQVK